MRDRITRTAAAVHALLPLPTEAIVTIKASFGERASVTPERGRPGCQRRRCQERARWMETRGGPGTDVASSILITTIITIIVATHIIIVVVIIIVVIIISGGLGPPLGILLRPERRSGGSVWPVRWWGVGSVKGSFGVQSAK